MLAPADPELGVEVVKSSPVDRYDVQSARLRAGLGLGLALIGALLALLAVIADGSQSFGLSSALAVAGTTLAWIGALFGTYPLDNPLASPRCFFVPALVNAISGSRSSVPNLQLAVLVITDLASISFVVGAGLRSRADYDGGLLMRAQWRVRKAASIAAVALLVLLVIAGALLVAVAYHLLTRKQQLRPRQFTFRSSSTAQVHAHATRTPTRRCRWRARCSRSPTRRRRWRARCSARPRRR